MCPACLTTMALLSHPPGPKRVVSPSQPRAGRDQLFARGTRSFPMGIAAGTTSTGGLTALVDEEASCDGQHEEQSRHNPDQRRLDHDNEQRSTSENRRVSESRIAS